MRTKLLAWCMFLLALAQVALVLVSWLLSAMTAGGVRPMLSAEGLRWFFGSFADGLRSPLLAWLLLAAMAGGCVVRSGVLGPATHYRQRLARRTALVCGIAYLGVIALLILPAHAVLLSATGALLPSPFSRALVPVMAFGVAAVSLVYGFFAGHVRTPVHVLKALSAGIAWAAPLFVVYVFLIQFCESLKYVFF